MGNAAQTGLVETKGPTAYDFMSKLLLSAGGFGEVYKIRRIQDQKDLAIKISTQCQDAKSEKELIHEKLEYHIGEIIQHPFIVRVHDNFILDKKQHIVMDLADGGDLQKFINERKATGKPFTETEVAKLVANIALGLNELHSNGIQHRDLKPANIVISKWEAGKSILKITDFGLSKDKNTYTPDTSTGATGTVIFSSPERFNKSTPGEKDTFGKEDIWALGCIAYYLSTFDFPFEDHDTFALMKKIMEGEHKPLASQGRSKQLSDFVDSMLQKSPDNRPSIH